MAPGTMSSDPTLIDLFRYRVRRHRDLGRAPILPKRPKIRPIAPPRNDPRVPQRDEPPPAA